MLNLKKRAEFLAVAKGRRVNRRPFALQALERPDSSGPRFGYTVTKKTGNAVERNRIRRRLREAVRTSGRNCALADHDYVLIGRRAALKLPFDALVDDLKAGLARVHRADSQPTAKPTRPGDRATTPAGGDRPAKPQEGV